MNPRSVVIVDDDEAVRDALSWLFSSKGLHTACFASGEALLAAFDLERMGCLVLDVRMAPLTGLVLFEQLRAAHPYCPPAIFLTGHADVPLAVAALKMGAADFLEKPFDDAILIERVEAALARDAAARDSLASRSHLQPSAGAAAPAHRARARSDGADSGRQTEQADCRSAGHQHQDRGSAPRPRAGQNGGQIRRGTGRAAVAPATGALTHGQQTTGVRAGGDSHG